MTMPSDAKNSRVPTEIGAAPARGAVVLVGRATVHHVVVVDELHVTGQQLRTAEAAHRDDEAKQRGQLSGFHEAEGLGSCVRCAMCRRSLPSLLPHLEGQKGHAKARIHVA